MDFIEDLALQRYGAFLHFTKIFTEEFLEKSVKGSLKALKILRGIIKEMV